jgi:hypothetical protein
MEMSIDEKVLGFDIRERWLPPHLLWDAGRRRTFLLREDVRKPLSTDTLVWPSVFDTGKGHSLPAQKREQLHLTGIPIPEWIGANAGIWDNLVRMHRSFSVFTAENWVASRPFTVLAITWLVAPGVHAGDFGPYPEPTVPAIRDPAWQLLGFDVSDGSLTSGLSNCGYIGDEKEQLRRSWAPNLNVHHLFAEAEPAFRFREITDQRVSEHAPFFVFGLYSVNVDA